MSQDFLSDDDMAKAEADAQPGAPDFISDEDMAKASAPALPHQSIVSNLAGQVGGDIAGSSIGSIPGNANAFAESTSRNIPVLGPAAVKAGLGMSAFLSRITPDSILTPDLRDKTIGELYDHFKQQDDETQAKLMSAHPEAATAGVVAGSMALPVPAAKMAGWAGAGARVAGQAAIAGANNYLQSGSAEDAASAAEFGGGATAALEALPVVGKIAGAVSNGLASTAEQTAFKAANGNHSKIYNATPFEKRGTIGRNLLDDGIVSAGNSARQIADKASTATEDYGGQIGDLLDKADSANDAGLVDGASPNGLVDGGSIASQIREYANTLNAPKNSSLAQNLEAQAQKFEEMGNMSLKDAAALKRQYVYDPSEPSTLSIGKKATNKINGILSGEMESGVATYADTVPDASDQSDVYQYLKDKYGSVAPTAKGATLLANRQAKNASLGLLDVLTGGIGATVGAATGGPVGAKVGAIAGAFGNKLVRERGPATLASITDSLSKASGGVEKFIPALQSAAQRGPQALAALHYVLSQKDPKYQAATTSEGDQ